MLFKYSGYANNGKKTKGKIEAVDLQNAKSKLKQKNILLTKIEEDRFNFFGQINFKRKYKISPLSLANISRDLSIYLKSGISLLNAIKLINEQYKKDKKLNPFFESIISFLDEGKNFYTALSMQKIIILPEFYLQSIKISEDGGLLQGVLLELSTYLKEQDKLKKQISQAMTYPIFIIVVAFFMVGFMLSFIVPKITAIFEQNNQALPPITQFVIDLGNFVSNYYSLILATIVLVIIFIIYSLKKFANFKYKVDKFLLKIPFIGKLIELGELSRFAYMNSILIKSGVSVVQSFKMGANILKNSVIKNMFIDASSKVVEGEKLSVILDKNDTYNIDIAFIQAIAIGEETSSLSEVLNNLSELYATANQDKINKFLSLLEPMLMLLVGSAIGFIVVAMLLPIFSMSIS